MQQKIFYACLILLLASCKTALFDGQPGQPQSEFPEAMQGAYFIKIPSSFFKRSVATDTVYFDIVEKEVISRDSNKTERTQLDENTSLRLVKEKYYLITQHDAEYKSYWNYTLIEPTKKGIRFFSFVEEKNNKLPKYFKRTFVTVNNAGDSVFAYKNNDVQLVKYIEKVLRKGEALELMRIYKK